MTRPVAPPAGLSRKGADLWRSVARHWAADRLTPDPRERRLLEDACREADMQAVLEEELAKARETGGLIVKGSMGQPVVNGLVNECRRSRSQVAALLGKLDLELPESGGDVVQLTGGGMTASQAGRRGAFRKHYGTDAGMP